MPEYYSERQDNGFCLRNAMKLQALTSLSDVHKLFHFAGYLSMDGRLALT